MGNDIVEGNIYDVSNFIPKPFTGRLRPVRSNMGIYFTNSNIFKNMVGDDGTIPFHKFHFSDLGDLDNFVTSHPKDTSPLYFIG